MRLFLSIIGLPVLIGIGVASAFWFWISPAAGFYSLGFSMIGIGTYWTWLSLVSPVQLQPIPLYLFIAGLWVVIGTAVVT